MSAALAPWLAEAWTGWAGRIADGRVPHALLVAGPAGLGKRALAGRIAASLLCTSREADAMPCERCRSCVLRAAGTHPDFRSVTFALNDKGEPRSEIVVEQIRELAARLVQTSQLGGWRVTLIDPADAMNVNAANALLKTLEEPEPATVLVLVSDRPSRLPATIRSRCQRIDVRFPARDRALEWLRERGVHGAAADDALELAAGNPGTAATLLEPESAALLAEVAEDLRALAQGRGSALETAQRWAKDQAHERLVCASELTRRGAWARAGAHARETALEFANLTAPCDFHKLAAWWDRANLVREQLKTPLRADLMLLDLLRDWRALATATRSA